MTAGKIPGTNKSADFFAEEVHALARIKGEWDSPRTNQDLLVSVLSPLYKAVKAYREDRIGTTTENGELAPGVLLDLADAVLKLLDIAGSLRRSVHPWDGMHRHHTDFFPDILGLTGYIASLQLAYPDHAIARIEKLAAQWVGRAGFWEIIVARHEFNKGQGRQEGRKA